MFSFYRTHVSMRLAVIWLAVTIPLSALLLVIYYQWYESRLSQVELDRSRSAQAAASSFELLLADIRLDLRVTGGRIGELGASSAESGPELRRLVSTHPGAYAVYATTEGTVIGSSDPALVGTSLSVDTAFRRAMRTGGGIGVEPSEEASGGLVGFHVAQTIPARAGRPGAVMMLFVDVRKLHDAFPEKVPIGGISLVDSEGQVVFQNEDVRFATTRARWADRFPFCRRALDGRTAHTRDFEFPTGGTRIGAFVPIKSIGWAAGSSVEPKAALASFYRSLQIGFPIAALIAALGLLVSIATARGVRRSLDELAEDARRVGSGGLEEPVRAGREDEIGDVGRSLEAARLELLDARRRAEREYDAKRMSEQRYRALFDSIDEGYCIVEMIFDESGKAIDYRFLEVNQAFERQTGLVDAQGKRMRELVPMHEEHWFQVFGQVALTGDPVRFENRAEQLRRWYDVYAFRVGEAEARQVAIVFNDISERRRADERIRHEIDTTQALLGAAGALAAPLQMDAVLATVARLIAEVSGCSRVSIDLLDVRTSQVHVIHILGEPRIPVGTRLPAGLIPAQALPQIEAGRPVVVDFETMSLPEESASFFERFDVRYALVVPLVAAGRVIGVIGVDEPGERREFDEHAVRVAEGIGPQAALAIENAMRYEEQARGRGLAEALDEVNRLIHVSLGSAQAVQRALELAGRELGAEAGALFLNEEGEPTARYQYGFPEDFLGSTYPLDASPFARLMVETREPVAVGEPQLAELLGREIARRFGIRSLLAIPLLSRGAVIGGLGLVFREPHEFTGAETDFARKFGAAVSLALENARLYEAEHHIAETLQTAFLALPDRIPGVDFAHLYRSATEAARVGGDFYDLFGLEHNLLGIVIGDIAGHGVDAAVLTSLVKNAIRVQATQQDSTPSDVLESASRILYDSSPEEVFATVFFGVLHLDDGLLEYCSAGHTTGACVHSMGGVSTLPTNSPLIGAFPEARFELSTQRLGVHDLLVLYTDGLTEARRDGELFGEERLFGILSREQGGDPDRVVRAVFDDVLAFSGGDLPDDLAILAVQRSGTDRG